MEFIQYNSIAQQQTTNTASASTSNLDIFETKKEKKNLDLMTNEKKKSWEHRHTLLLSRFQKKMVTKIHENQTFVYVISFIFENQDKKKEINVLILTQIPPAHIFGN